MIGVVADPKEHAALGEFFEVFKTPWELYRRGGEYEVLLSTGDCEFEPGAAKLVVLYSGRKLHWDEQNHIEIGSEANAGWARFQGIKLPIYGDSISFRSPDGDVPDQVACTRRAGGKTFTRVGYGLAGEVSALLTEGQPAANAAIPTLELHIALLRDIILANGIPLVEIPPVPDGYSFIACLTHDIDHPSLRQHRWDHTMLGFLYRAVIGSVIDAIRGRKPVKHVWANWLAALNLPLVHLGLATDFWFQFDRYVEIEGGFPSSFFVIPFKHDPGKTRDGTAPGRRASAYGAPDIADCLYKLRAAGCEIGLHGLDAWIDASRGQEEFAQIKRVMGGQQQDEVGVRMHWLYFDRQSPVTLEQSGASYDSTVGYNETIGYRAGTTQVYKPLSTVRLLELPLHVMDTALFYPSYLHLSAEEARKQISGMIDNAVRFGGSITLNWHDRSLAPERLWGDTYANAIEECKAKGAWICTAAQAVSWFRRRRAASFESGRWKSNTLPARVPAAIRAKLPGLRLRFHQPRHPLQNNSRVEYRDLSLTESLEARVTA